MGGRRKKCRKDIIKEVYHGQNLVTGATGNIGSQLVKRLKEKNLEEWNIRVMESLNRRIKLGLSAVVTSNARIITGKDPTPFTRLAGIMPMPGNR